MNISVISGGIIPINGMNNIPLNDPVPFYLGLLIGIVIVYLINKFA